jgi:hypothetical protein
MCKESRYGITTESPSQLALTTAFHRDDQATLDYSLYCRRWLQAAIKKIAWNEHIYGRAGFFYLLCLRARGPHPTINVTASL